MKEDDGSRLKVIRNPKAILRIDNPSHDLILEALRRDGLLIKHFRKPTLDMQLAAYRQNPDSAMLIDDPHPSLWLNILHDQGEVEPSRMVRGGTTPLDIPSRPARPLSRFQNRFTM